MQLQGIVRNGVIVLTGGVSLPEGTAVTVSRETEPDTPPRYEQRQVVFPLVCTGKPGSMNLTDERIAEIFEQEDVEYARRFFPDPPQD